jgi:hypothetical protein
LFEVCSLHSYVHANLTTISNVTHDSVCGWNEHAA